MDIRSSAASSIPPNSIGDKQSFFDGNDPSKIKSTKEIQQETIKAAQSEKLKEKELQKIEDKEDKKKIQQELNELVAKLNKEVTPIAENIKFGFNDDIDGLMVNVVDAKTGEVIRQFPTEDAIEIMKKMKELIGMLFDKKG